MRVYIAGPHDEAHSERNINLAIQAADALATIGHKPYIPHLFHLWHHSYPHHQEFWLDQAKEWLDLCDAVLCLSSKKGSGETRYANSVGIPVYRSMEQLVKADKS